MGLQKWAAFAKPGSPVFLAGGDIADAGPRVVSAERTGPDTLRLLVAQDHGSGFAPLDADAARGLGWAVSGLGDPRHRGAGDRGGGAEHDRPDLRRPAAGSGGVLHYGRGYGRLAEGKAPGRGNAVTDEAGLPIWTLAKGVAIGAPAVPDDALRQQ